MHKFNNLLDISDPACASDSSGISDVFDDIKKSAAEGVTGVCTPNVDNSIPSQGFCLTGNKTLLRPLAKCDLAAIETLLTDEPTMRMYLPTCWRIFRNEQATALLQDWHDNSENFVWVIVEKLSREPAGAFNLSEVDWPQRHLDVGLAILPKFRRLGLGLEATGIMINYCFNQLNMHHLTAHIIEDNIPSHRLFQNCGFRSEGSLREQVFRDGKYLNMDILGLLRCDFIKNTKENFKNKENT